MTTPSRPSLREMLRFFLWLGAAGFGGPIALVGYMEREFVERRRWITLQESKDGLAFAQLAPGPLAAQLAIYLGWLCGGVKGATVVGIAFVAPSFLMVLALAALYIAFGGMSWLQGAFYGIGAVAIAIIARSALKLARSTLGRDTLSWALFAASAGVTAWTGSEFVWLFVLSGVVTLLARSKSREAGAGALSMVVSLQSPTAHSGLRVPGWLLTGLSGAAPLATSGTLFLYFTSAGLFVFGSGLAIVPFLHGGVVQEHRWLTERQFLDAVAVALITPGPVVITVLLAPHYDRYKTDQRVHAFIEGVTAAATGAIAGAAIVLGRRAITDLTTVAVAGVTLLWLTYGRRVPDPLVIVAAGIVGVVVTASRGS